MVAPQLLVDWDHLDFGRKIVLTLQTRAKRSHPDDKDETTLILDKEQAAALANLLQGFARAGPTEARWIPRLVA